jgi:hypothetical protein
MFGSVLGKGLDALGQRFFLVALYPATAFWAAVMALVAGRHGWEASLAWWAQRGRDGWRVWLLAAAIVGLLVFAAFLVYWATAIVRLYEGHWQARKGMGWLGAPGRWLQRTWYRRLLHTGPASFETRSRFFLPQEEEIQGELLLPTRLGNVLRSAETYPASPRRYAMDGVFFWPRLYGVLPEATRSSLGQARSAIDTMLTLSLLAWLYVPVAVGVLLATGAGWDAWAWWLAAVGGGLLVGVMAYRAGVSAALVFAELVRSSFDLYRHDLLKQLGYATPASLQEEQRLWHNLAQQLTRLGADDETVLRYATARTAPATSNSTMPRSAAATAALLVGGWAAGVVSHVLLRQRARHNQQPPK